MIEIGTKCRILNAETVYKITDIREKELFIKINDKTHSQTNIFVDLEESKKPNVKVKDIAVENLTSISM